MTELQMIGLVGVISSVIFYSCAINEMHAGRAAVAYMCNGIAVLFGVAAVVIGILT